MLNFQEQQNYTINNSLVYKQEKMIKKLRNPSKF